MNQPSSAIPNPAAGREVRRVVRPRALLMALALLCADGRTMAEPPGRVPPRAHPDVIAVQVRAGPSSRFDFDVTVSSPYDSASRYADAFRVRGKDGSVFGERRLLHDHANEQPFTRDLYGVVVPAGVRVVVVEARDSANGYGGRSMDVVLPGRR